MSGKEKRAVVRYGRSLLLDGLDVPSLPPSPLASCKARFARTPKHTSSESAAPESPDDAERVRKVLNSRLRFEKVKSMSSGDVLRFTAPAAAGCKWLAASMREVESMCDDDVDVACIPES